ncbi:hypothetical protein MCUN1_001000 [Malassezia cuniculi]|uniref:PX domain-containing protein n=1 Tax=Malassezia cuniculi TaxID=948313 RepID=A0AAF0ESC0_9BASI|nr:hypothetical protein MCUN1_001000 [Malassezia cuniculi]
MGTGTNPFLQPAPSAPTNNGNIAGLVNPFAPLALTPLRAHYLKKALVQLQLRNELRLLQRPDALSLLGAPFSPPKDHTHADLPFLRHIVRRFVLSFPFLNLAPPAFFSDKVQVVAERFFSRNILLADPEAAVDGSKLFSKVEKHLVLLLSSAIRAKGTDEDVVRIGEADRERLFVLDSQRRAAAGEEIHTFEFDVCSVRTITVKGRLRNRTRDEFIIMTRRDSEVIYVARRYGDVRALYDALRIAFPESDIPQPPNKDRSASSVTAEDPNAQSPQVILSRERNRHTLRAYIRSLLAIPSVADSEAMHDFFVSDPIQLTESEKQDVAARARADELRNAENEQFEQETAARAAKIREHLGSFKDDLLKPGGFVQFFDTIKRCPTMADLPDRYRVLIDWAQVSFASAMFSAFASSDSASSNFAQLKYMHSIMPYFVIRGILRISNPVSMIRAMIDLFLAQPFGQKSLLQRMFSGRLHEEIDSLNELSERVLDKIGDTHFGVKIVEYIASPADVQDVYRGQVATERIDIMTAIMRSPIGGPLEAHQVHQIVRASRAYERLKRARRQAIAQNKPEPAPENDEQWLYEDLHVYLRIQQQIYDKKQLIDLIYDNATADLLKDVVTIFYAPLAEVYKLANIADTLGEMQQFVNDLIRTVDAYNNGTTGSTRPVDTFLELIKRHENVFYNFVRQVHTKGSDLFGALISWVELFISFVNQSNDMSQGLGSIDLELCLPAGDDARKRALAQVDEYVKHTYRRKLMREVKVRRKLMRQTVAKAGQSRAQRTEDEQFLSTVMEQLGVEELFSAQIDDVEAEEDSSSDGEAENPISDESSDDEGPEDVEHFRHRWGQRKQAKEAEQSNDPFKVSAPPNLDAIAEMLPVFVELLRPSLEISNPIK